MSDEIKAAAERWRAYQYHVDYADSSHARHVAGRDARDLADAYIADQAQREREQAERDLPIDEAWLASIGTNENGEFHIGRLQLVEVVTGWSKVHAFVQCRIDPEDNIAALRDCTNRGQLLDLLSALQINTKGEA